MKCLINTDSQPSFENIDYEIIYHYTQDDGTYLKQYNLCYEVSDIVLNPDNIVMFPVENVELNFVGKTYSILDDGTRQLIKEQNITYLLDFLTEEDLVGDRYWNGQKIHYEASKEVGVATVLYVRENAQMTYDHTDGKNPEKVDGYEYKLVEINDKIDDALKNKGYSPIAILGGTAEQMNERNSEFKTYEDGGEDLFIALESIGNKMPIMENYQGDNLGYDLTFGVYYSAISATVIVSLVNNATSSSRDISDFDNTSLVIKNFSGASETLAEVNAHRTVQNTKMTLSLDVMTNTPVFDSERNVEFTSGLTSTAYTFPSYDEILTNDAYSYRDVINFNESNLGLDGNPWFKNVVLSGSAGSLNTQRYKILQTNAPSAAACYAYKTEGTKKTSWHLPSVGEMVLIKNVNLSNLVSAMDILDDDIVRIFDTTNTSLPLEYDNEPCKFYRKKDCDEITSSITYNNDNLKYVVRLYQKDDEEDYYGSQNRGEGVASKLFDIRSCKYGYDGYGVYRNDIALPDSKQTEGKPTKYFASPEVFYVHDINQEGVIEVKNLTEPQDIKFYQVKSGAKEMIHVSKLDIYTVHTSSVQTRSGTQYPINVTFTQIKRAYADSPDTVYPVFNGRFR